MSSAQQRNHKAYKTKQKTGKVWLIQRKQIDKICPWKRPDGRATKQRLESDYLDSQLTKDVEKVNKTMNKMEPSTKRKQKETMKKFWIWKVQ